jgi:hypothetical protein
MDRDERLDRLDTYIREGRLLRRAWIREEGGRACACLLAALAPEVGAQEDPQACPVALMPSWFACMTVWLDDAGSDAAWPAMVVRYASLARRWDILDHVAWRRLDYGARASVLREARALVPDDGSASALRAFDALRALLDRAAQGEEIEAAEWASSTSAATSAIGSEGRLVELVMCGATEGLAAAAAFELEMLLGAAIAAEADHIASAVFDAIEREIKRAAESRSRHVGSRSQSSA